MSHSFTFTTHEMKAGASFELLEPGWYSFEVVNAYDYDRYGEPLVTRKGVPFFKLVCRESESGGFLFHYLFLDPEQAHRVSAFLQAIGYELEEGQEVTLHSKDFVGHSFRGRIENEPGKDGVKRNRITRVEAPEVEKEEGEKEEGEVELEITDSPPDPLDSAQPTAKPETKEEDEVPF